MGAHPRGHATLSHNAGLTDLEVTPANVAASVGIGRSRWKIENAHFNGHKNRGYDLEHNSGHGAQTLSMVLYLLNLFACIAHLILERGDRLSQRCLATTSRRERWPTLRTAIRMTLVNVGADFLLLSRRIDSQSLGCLGPGRDLYGAARDQLIRRKDSALRRLKGGRQRLSTTPMFLASCLRQALRSVF
jgi:hypothetical protein